MNLCSVGSGDGLKCEWMGDEDGGLKEMLV